MKVRLFLINAVLGLFLLPAPLFAHHNFRAEFDDNLPVMVTGTVTRFAMTNPHARIYVDVEDENGEVVNWNFELGAASGLLRRGWKKDSLEPGDTVTINAFRARNDPLVGNARRVTLITEDGEYRVFGQAQN